jgi:hypothetical protein
MVGSRLISRLICVFVDCGLIYGDSVSYRLARQLWELGWLIGWFCVSLLVSRSSCGWLWISWLVVGWLD